MRRPPLDDLRVPAKKPGDQGGGRGFHSEVASKTSPVTQLVWILPCCSHRPTLPWIGSLHKTRGDSHQAAEHEQQASARRDRLTASYRAQHTADQQARIDALLLETIDVLARLLTSHDNGKS